MQSLPIFQKRFKSNFKIRIHFDWLENYLNKKSYPICLEIDPANYCPLNCSYCCWSDLRSSAKMILPEKKLLSLVSEANELGVKSIIWTGGGEPLANPATCEAIKLSRSLGMDNGMFTNAVLLRKEIAKILINNLNWIRFHVGASTPKGYSQMHQVAKGVFRTVCNNIKQFTEFNKGKVSAGIGVVVNPINFQYVADLPRLAKELGLEFFQAKLDFEEIGKDEYVVWWQDIVIPHFTKIKKHFGNKLKVHVFSDPIVRSTKATYCHAHHVITAITADGRVAFCKMRRDQKNTTLGNVFENSLREIFDSEQHQKIANAIQPKTCPILNSFCPYRTTNEVIDELVNIKQTTNPMHINFF